MSNMAQSASGRGRRSVRLWFGFLGAPAAWTVHLLTSYTVHALGCRAGVGSALRWWLIGLTLVCAAVATAAGVVGYGTWRRTHQGPLGAQSPPAGAAAFVGLAGVLLSAVFVLGILLGGLVPAIALPLCR
ncbi:MAG TPA: hypothetical protein VFK13_15290 [Gemmatimonadaceae bacterium]|nr:hypothetical protein [Gemmatimonadaceae bacterium]